MQHVRSVIRFGSPEFVRGIPHFLHIFPRIDDETVTAGKLSNVWGVAIHVGDNQSLKDKVNNSSCRQIYVVIGPADSISADADLIKRRIVVNASELDRFFTT